MQTQPDRIRINTKQIVIGLIGLLIGIVFYLVDRPPGDVYFVRQLGSHLSRYGKWPVIFGRFGASLPAFIHAFSFSLISTGIMAARIRGAIAICSGWVLVDILFEIGQKYHAVVNPLIPDWFDGILFLENTRAYFREGTYDMNDVIATCIGGGVAFLVIVMTLRRKTI